MPSTTIQLWPSDCMPLEAALGKYNVVMDEPLTGSEDFSVFVEQEFPASISI